jgi:hypothetical protein
MLKFIKGEFKGGNTDSMFITDCGDVTIDNFWKHQLSEECWILEVPEKVKDIGVYNAWNRGIDCIPEYEYYYDDGVNDDKHDVFWNSNETYVFKSFDDAMNFMKGYKGIYKMLFEHLQVSATEWKTEKEALALYRDIERIRDDIDYCFLVKIKDLIDSHKLNNIEAMATLKMVILDSYKISIKEKRLSRLN